MHISDAVALCCSVGPLGGARGHARAHAARLAKAGLVRDGHALSHEQHTARRVGRLVDKVSRRAPAHLRSRRRALGAEVVRLRRAHVVVAGDRADVRLVLQLDEDPSAVVLHPLLEELCKSRCGTRARTALVRLLDAAAEQQQEPCARTNEQDADGGARRLARHGGSWSEVSWWDGLAGTFFGGG